MPLTFSFFTSGIDICIGCRIRYKIMTNGFLNDGRIIQNYRQTAQMKQEINTANNVLVYSYKPEFDCDSFY